MKKTILYIKSDDCIKDKLERLFELTDVNNNIEIIVPLLFEDYLKIDKMDAYGFIIKFSSKKIYIELFTSKNDIIDYIKTFWNQCIFDVYDIVSDKDINSKSYIDIKTLDSYMNNADQDTKEFIENIQNPKDTKGILGPKGEQGLPYKDSLEKVLKKLKPFVKNYTATVNKVFIPILKDDYKLLNKYLKVQLKDNVEWVLCSDIGEIRTAVSELNYIFGSVSKDTIIDIYNNK